MFIPNTLEEVADFERDIAMAAKGQQVRVVLNVVIILYDRLRVNFLYNPFQFYVFIP